MRGHTRKVIRLVKKFESAVKVYKSYRRIFNEDLS